MPFMIVPPELWALLRLFVRVNAILGKRFLESAEKSLLLNFLQARHYVSNRPVR
jgi:hypothetical protein